MYDKIHFLFQLAHAQQIARRYIVTNGFDSALTMLGLTMGFYSSEKIAIPVIISACLGAAIALSVSGLTSAYISELAERKKELRELEQALVDDLGETAHGQAARWVPVFISLVNGLAPLLVALLIITPLWLAQTGFVLPIAPLEASILVAFLALFALGAFLGTVSGGFWLWNALGTLAIAVVTAAFIFWLEV